ncbi:MAG: hypothetical protein ABSE62_11375 [Chthoniobacteraceae bacterium]|jgi:hypothetical protein
MNRVNDTPVDARRKAFARTEEAGKLGATMRPFLRRLMWLAALLILGFLAWGGYYVCNRGFSRHWRLRVSQEFRRRGLDLYVHRLTLDPIHGLVARDVQIFDSSDPTRVLATIDRVALDINLSNLLHSRPFLDAVDLRNADLSLPVNPDDPQSERVKVSQLNARVIFPPHEWYVSQAEATMYGIQVSARGRLQNPEAFQPGNSAAQRAGAAGRQQLSFDVLRLLESLHYGAAPPQIDINFGGDLAEPASVFADATIWGTQVERGGAELSQAYAALSLRNRVIQLKQADIGDAGGELEANGYYNMDNGKTSLELRSTLGPANVARLLKLPGQIDEWSFPTPPVLELSGSGTLGTHPAGLLIGHLAVKKFTARDTDFNGAGADFSWDGQRWYVRNGWIGNATGSAHVQAISVPGEFRAQIDSTINPNSLSGFLSGPAADGMRDWDFEESPKAYLTITGTSADPACWETQGWVGLGRTSMRGVPFDWASANVDARGMVFTYRDFIVQRDEGAATGTFSYDFGRHESWLTNIHTHLNTTEAAVWVDPGLARQVAPYRFKSAPDLTLNGFVQCATGKGTHLDVQVNAPGGLDYTFCKRTLSFPNISGDVFFGENRIILTNVYGKLFGGPVMGGADIRLGRDAPGYTAQVEVNQIDFASLTRLYFNYNDSHGLLNGHFDFGGVNDDPWTLYGKGAVEVREGNVFAIPLLGPFSSILNSVVPGMGYNVAHDGTATYTVKNGVITTHDFVVKGLGFSMIGDGRLLFLDDRLNFNIRLNMQGLPGVLLFPVSKLLEYSGTGTLEDPNWKPVLLEGRSSPQMNANSIEKSQSPSARETH